MALSEQDEFTVQVMLAEEGASDLRLNVLREMADALDRPVDLSSPEATAHTARDLLVTCGQRASLFVFEKLRAYLAAHGKKLMVLLTYSAQEVIDAAHGRPRFDQFFVDYLTQYEIPFVDGLTCHLADFRSYACPVEEYVQRNYIGHYNPTGNHFFAFAIKDAVVAWLVPKPPAYREGGPSLQTVAAELA